MPSDPDTETDTDDQPGGILTPPQRAYLRGNTDIDPDSSHARVTRSRIRDRLQAALSVDLELLSDELRADDRNRVLEGLDATATESLIELVAWVHQAADSIGVSTETLLEHGIERGEHRRGTSDVTVDVDIDIAPGLDQLEQRFNAGDPTLTGSELARLQRETAIDPDNLTAYYRETLDDPVETMSPTDESADTDATDDSDLDRNE